VGGDVGVYSLSRIAMTNAIARVKTLMIAETVNS
jgi:hypothetical protein